MAGGGENHSFLVGSAKRDAPQDWLLNVPRAVAMTNSLCRPQLFRVGWGTEIPGKVSAVMLALGITLANAGKSAKHVSLDSTLYTL